MIIFRHYAGCTIQPAQDKGSKLLMIISSHRYAYHDKNDSTPQKKTQVYLCFKLGLFLYLRKLKMKKISCYTLL